MLLQTLTLKNFRLYTDRQFKFCPKINVICGPNACGKTTVLEAIHLLMTGRSFRTGQLRDMIREGAPFFAVEATFLKQGIEQSLTFFYDGNERKILYHHTPCRSLAGLLGIMQGVAMFPEDVALIKGAPSVRRRYLDMQLAQANPLYVHHLARYHRAMRQRNHLLRKKDLRTIETWEQEMAKAAVYLITQRRQAVEDLQVLSQQTLHKLSDSKEQLSLVYQTIPKKHQESIFSYYCEQYKTMRQREVHIGYTLGGPHRDDMRILLENKEAKYFASEGQQGSCVAALRLAEWERLSKLAEDSPLMFVDDIGIHFDQTRRAYLMSLLGSLQQVVLTTTEEPKTMIEPSLHTIHLRSYGQSG
ncbi:MAG: DNA replication/repair protein RecF [Waddliaceae bacterium]